jgi:hypothetical protein
MLSRCFLQWSDADFFEIDYVAGIVILQADVP